LITCSVCDKGNYITKEEAQKIQPVSELNLKLAKKQITEEQYGFDMRNLDATQALDSKTLLAEPNLSKNLEGASSKPTPNENKIAELILLILGFILFYLGAKTETYNGYLVACGWVAIIATVYMFNRKDKTFSK
jgi:hypothetical protein